MIAPLLSINKLSLIILSPDLFEIISISPSQFLKVLFSTKVFDDFIEFSLVPILIVSPPFLPKSGLGPKKL